MAKARKNDAVGVTAAEAERMAANPNAKGARLELRLATPKDVAEIVALTGRVYKDEGPYLRGQIAGQVANFPEGQFVAVLEGAIVGYAACFIVKEWRAFRQHTWDEITGDGHAARHDETGDWLYGMEVCVDPAIRRLKIASRLYEARRALVRDRGLKGTVFAARMPGWKRARKSYDSPEGYLDAVRAGRAVDPAVSFQMKRGFEPRRVLRDYHPPDRESGGHAVLMTWTNEERDDVIAAQPVTRGGGRSVRVCTVQMEARRHDRQGDFFARVEHFVRVAAEYDSDFVVFPEFFTLQLLAENEERLSPVVAIERLSALTPTLVRHLSDWAVRHNVNIIGGSHPTRTEDGDIQNVAYVALRDGAVHAQEKLHPTPDEREVWNIQGGDAIDAIDTDCGPIGVMICYDSEFPELGRRLADQGARIFFVPYCTDARTGHLRVRYCCHARAIENQAFVVTSGNVGNLHGVANFDIQYAQSAILTPSDFPFARDGVAAETTANVEQVVFADLDLGQIAWARARGSVRNLRDRRFDLYATRWK